MNFREQWNKFSRSNAPMVVVVVLGEMLVGLLIFHAGYSYGERSAYGRMHGAGYATSPLGFGFLPHGFMPEGHGAVGTISSISLPTFTLQERDGDEEVVRVSSSTSIRADSGANALQVGEAVVVIGEPNDGDEQMNAIIIHILPSPPPNK